MFYKLLRRLPWWLRLTLFIVIALPLFNMHLVTGWVADDAIAHLTARAVYAAMIWAFILACVGLDKFFTYMSTAALMCVATVIIGSTVVDLLGLAGDGEKEKLLFNEQTMNVAFMLMISIPYAFFVIQAFSASQLLERLSGKAGVANHAQMSIAVCLRVFQHLAEMFPTLMIVWKEENPSLLLPRHVDDWRSQHFLRRLISKADWGYNAAMSWARCLLVFSLRIVPVVDLETKRLASHQK